MTRQIALLVTHFLLFASSSSAQELELKWKVVSRKLDSARYEVSATTSLPPGWHLYTADSAEGLEPFDLKFDYEGLIEEGAAIYNGNTATISDPVFSKKLRVYTGEVSIIQLLRFNGDILPSLPGTLIYYIGKGEEFLQKETSFVLEFQGASLHVKNDILLPSVDLTRPLAACGDSSIKEESLWMIFLLGFLGGLIGLLTPCVFSNDTCYRFILY